MRSFDEYKDYVEEHLLDVFPECDPEASLLFDSMFYSLNAGGKRLRPVLMLASCELAGGKISHALPYACAMEYIHTYSLIHDDLPAMDNDDLRRGKPTNRVVYGPGIATLAGDGLLNYAYETAVKSFIYCPGDTDVEKAMFILASKPGIYGMLGGQTADVVLTGKKPTAKQLSYIYSNKTAALLECAMTIGATLAGVSGEELDKLQNAAYYIGMAFQVQDDILDVTGNPEELGKDVSQDEKNGKVTFVSIYGLDKASEYVKQASELAITLINEAYTTFTTNSTTTKSTSADGVAEIENVYLKLLIDLVKQLVGRRK